MMHVFGLIFDVALAYEAKYGSPVGAPNISDGRKLNRFVTVNAAELRRWRS